MQQAVRRHVVQRPPLLLLVGDQELRVCVQQLLQSETREDAKGAAAITAVPAPVRARAARLHEERGGAEQGLAAEHSPEQLEHGGHAAVTPPLRST